VWPRRTSRIAAVMKRIVESPRPQMPTGIMPELTLPPAARPGRRTQSGPAPYSPPAPKVPVPEGSDASFKQIMPLHQFFPETVRRQTGVGRIFARSGRSYTAAIPGMPLPAGRCIRPATLSSVAVAGGANPGRTSGIPGRSVQVRSARVSACSCACIWLQVCLV
jgi:hypothetical protein